MTAPSTQIVDRLIEEGKLPSNMRDWAEAVVEVFIHGGGPQEKNEQLDAQQRVINKLTNELREIRNLAIDSSANDMIGEHKAARDKIRIRADEGLATIEALKGDTQ